MAVNPLQPAVSYSIGASNEASDNPRQRQEKLPLKEDSRFKQKATEPPTKNTTDSEETNTQDKEAIELTGQIIDSQTVVQLLSHRPKYQRSPKNCFKIKKSSQPNSQSSDIPKLNKAY